MQHRRPPQPRVSPGLWLVDLALVGVAAVGIAGAVYVSDLLDLVRWPLMHWFAIPGSLFYLASRLLYPHWPAARPRASRWLLGAFFAVFSLGAFSLLNAVSSDGVKLKRTVEQGHGLAIRDVQRGGFGVLFKTRATW